MRGPGRAALVDVSVVAVFAAWALLQGLGADSMYSLGSHLSADRVLLMQLTSVVLTATGAVALTQRRRRPVVVAAVLAALGVVSLAVTGATNGIELGLAIALHAVASVGRPRALWPVTGASVGVVLGAAAVLPAAATVGAVMVAGNGGPAALRAARPDGAWGFVTAPAWWATALPVTFLALAGVGLGLLARSRRAEADARAEAAEARRREQLERERAGESAERARIAREMHDVIAHSISVMVALGGGASAAFDWAPDRARAALDELVDTGRSALGDMRRILGVLHDDTPPGAGGALEGDVRAPLDPHPDGLDLVRLVARARTAGLPVRAVGLELDEVDTARRLAVYRVVQESLTNVLRHAPGTPGVEVVVDRRAAAIDVEITNATPPHVPAPGPPGSGRGVTGMRQRAAAFGGTVEAGPHDAGWRVRAVLPVSDEGEG